jgi:hypothetical protein
MLLLLPLLHSLYVWLHIVAQKPAFMKQLVADGYLKIAIALIGDKDNVLV